MVTAKDTPATWGEEIVEKVKVAGGPGSQVFSRVLEYMGIPAGSGK
jgi:hypothetical protein